MKLHDIVGLEEEARESVAARLAGGKGVLPTERRNEQVERRVSAGITERAREGEHFPPSLPPCATEPLSSRL